MDITMVKAHITAQFDMNLTIICERIMELQLRIKEDKSDDDERITKILDLDGGWCLWGADC